MSTEDGKVDGEFVALDGTPLAGVNDSLSAGELLQLANEGKPVPIDRVLATYADPANWTQIYHGVVALETYEAKACEWAFIGPMRPPFELAQWALKTANVQAPLVSAGGYPALPVLQGDLKDILGMMITQTAAIGRRLHALGIYKVPRKVEEEHAAALHWMLNLYFAHGDQWRSAGQTILQNKAQNNEKDKP